MLKCYKKVIFLFLIKEALFVLHVFFEISGFHEY